MRFNRPRHLCEKCCAIDQQRSNRTRRATKSARCSVCAVDYIETPDYQQSEFERYLSRETRLDVRFSDLIAHGRTLAEIGQSTQNE
jgi:hypothetical protein